MSTTLKFSVEEMKNTNEKKRSREDDDDDMKMKALPLRSQGVQTTSTTNATTTGTVVTTNEIVPTASTDHSNNHSNTSFVAVSMKQSCI